MFRSLALSLGMLAAMAFLLAPAPAFAHEAGDVIVSVTIDGMPVASGRIFVHLDDSQFVGASFKEGKCQLKDVPLGEHTITFDGEGLPKKYVLKETSGLKISVAEGGNEFEFQLTSK